MLGLSQDMDERITRACAFRREGGRGVSDARYMRRGAGGAPRMVRCPAWFCGGGGADKFQAHQWVAVLDVLVSRIRILDNLLYLMQETPRSTTIDSASVVVVMPPL